MRTIGNSVVRKPTISIKDTLHGSSSTQEKVEEVMASNEEAETAPVHKKGPVDPDRILNAWNAYANSIEKNKPRIFSTLKYNRPVVKADGTVMVLLNSEAQCDNFLKNIKPQLVSYIRNATGVEMVEIMAEVTEVEQNGKKIYTEQDKLDFLMNKNPELGHLKSRFNLDFDD